MKTWIMAVTAGTLAAGLFALAPASAGPDKIAFPTGYQAGWVLLGTLDRYDNKTVRRLYMNPEAFEAAKAGQPMPDGTYLVLDSRSAKLGPDSQPLRDDNGRFIADDKVTSVAAQQKRKGWGGEYPDNLRNGDWEYSVFTADGTRRPDLNTQACFGCHKPREANDFTFIAKRVVDDYKKSDAAKK